MHYSAVKHSQLIDACSAVSERGGKRPEWVLIRRVRGLNGGGSGSSRKRA
jgi:hypothetical protein